ncbi:hypothetical protein BOX15_Mlig031767g6 [Macrostomum lignano]|uniref:RUN domain-containing protein n=1 Tax=Macrostomum lignano TaxID=282301 RepID=A0A267G866_9PLAT|nr:hypothetical protein BOX15_Mlig031767g6 [Macrostomum lignano]
MKSESQAYARLYRENRVKDEILRSLTRAYREICCYCVEHPDAEITDDPSTNLAASCIEAFFLHRIKGRGARRIASFITGSDQSPLPTSSPDCDVNYWQFIRAYIPHRLQMQLLQRPQHQRSEIGCCRAWVRACLNEGTTSSYLASVLQDRDRISRYYYANSLILDAERGAVFLELVKSLDEAEFQLNLQSSLLNFWSSSAAPQLLLLPTESEQPPRGQADQRSFVHPGLTTLLQRHRSVSMPTATPAAATAARAQQSADQADAEAAFQRAEASILSGAVADIRRQLDEIRRQQQAGGRPQQLAGRGRRRQQQQQQQQLHRRDDDAIIEEDEAAECAAAAAFASNRTVVGDSLRARVRCEASWSAPQSGLAPADFNDFESGATERQEQRQIAAAVPDEGGGACSVTGVSAEAAEAESSNTELHSQQQQQQPHQLSHHRTSWAGVWSSSVDAGVAANAAVAATASDDLLIQDQLVSMQQQQQQHSASAPDIESRKTETAASLAEEKQAIAEPVAGDLGPAECIAADDVEQPNNAIDIVDNNDGDEPATAAPVGAAESG